MDNKDFEKIVVVNADQKEFEETYREITMALADLKQTVENMEFDMDRVEKQVRGMRKIIQVFEERATDEDVEEILNFYRTKIKQSKEQEDYINEIYSTNKERLMRAEEFVKNLKTDLIIGKKENTYVLNESWLVLINLFHSVLRVLTPEEIAKHKGQGVQ